MPLRRASGTTRFEASLVPFAGEREGSAQVGLAFNDGFHKVPGNPGVYFRAFASIELELDELVVSSLMLHQKTL